MLSRLLLLTLESALKIFQGNASLISVFLVANRENEERMMKVINEAWNSSKTIAVCVCM